MMNQSGNFEVRQQMRRVKVFHRGRYVTAFNDCNWRPYVYPLCSPRGACMLHEASVDHPFHNGVFFGHQTVDPGDDGGPVDFWVPRYSPLHTFCSGSIICRDRTWEPAGDGTIRFREQSQWLAPLAVPLIDQETEYEIRCGESVNAMIIRATFTARRPVKLMPTKEALLAVRIADTFCVHNGGKMIDAAGGVNEPQIMDAATAWIDCQGGVGEEVFGLLIHQQGGREPTAWFARDYGLVAIFDFRLGGDLALEEGQRYQLYLPLTEGK